MEQPATIRLCEFKFKRQCPLNWGALTTTADRQTRYCGTCDQMVFLCESDEETMRHAELGHCIARGAAETGIVLGESDLDWLQEEARKWRQREHNNDAALSNLKFPANRCSVCGYPLPSWWEACLVCGTVDRDKPPQ